MKIIYTLVVCLLLSCASQYKFKTEVVDVPVSNAKYIDNWKKNGEIVLRIDTVKGFDGKINKFKVTVKSY